MDVKSIECTPPTTATVDVLTCLEIGTLIIPERPATLKSEFVIVQGSELINQP